MSKREKTSETKASLVIIKGQARKEVNVIENRCQFDANKNIIDSTTK